MKNKLLAALFVSLFLSACSKKDNDVYKQQSFYPTIQIKRLPDGHGRTNVWVQGKMCADGFGRLYIGYTSGSAHNASDLVSYTSYSDDKGATWSPLKLIKPDNGTNSKGTRCSALGVDSTRKLWAIIQNKGDSFSFGKTYHELWTSTDYGVTWTFIDVLGEITSHKRIIGNFYDMIQIGDKMITSYHSDSGSKVGFLSIDIANPKIRAHTDVIDDGGPHDFAEASLCYDSVNNKIIGGLRSELSAPQLFYMNTDFTGFEKFTSACTILRSPMPVKIVSDKIVYMGIERNLTGEVALYIGNLSDLYSKKNTSTHKITLGYIVGNPIVGTSNAGVPDVEVMDGLLHFGFSQQRDDGASSVYYGNCDPLKLTAVNPLTYPNFATLKP
ncbi:MAG: sialidase family protein [Mucilaginibacter sp.]